MGLQGSWRGIKVGLTIIGTMIGAGFASGREIWEFFGSYGPNSQYSMMVAMVLFLISTFVILWISTTYRTKNYSEVLEKLMGRRMASLFDLLTMLYLIGMSVVMFAGSGATFSHWNLSYKIGVVVLAIAVYVVLLFDVRGLMSIQSVIIPMLIGVLLFVCFRFIMGSEGTALPVQTYMNISWPSGITYAALNIVPLIAVISTLGRELKSTGELIIATGISTIGLASVAFLMNYSLMIVAKDIPFYEIPLFSLLQSYSSEMILVVSVILWLAIYTTALSGIHGIVFRISSYLRSPIWLTSLIIILLMMPLSQFGFTTLVSVLYPLFGVVNLFVLGLLILYPIGKTLEKKKQ